MPLNCSWRRCWQHLYYLRDEPVSPPRDGLDEARLLRIILQHMANLADGRVDAVVSIEEYIRTPDPLDDLVPGDQLASPLYQEEQQFHGNPLQLENPAVAAQFISAQIQLEILPKPDLVCHFDRVGNHKQSAKNIASIYIGCQMHRQAQYVH